MSEVAGMGRASRAAPNPPAGLTAVRPSLWLPAWRRVRVQPSVEVKPWDGGAPVRITASVKNVGVWAHTFAGYEDGTRIFPGVEVLALVAGVTERTAGQAMCAICQLGFMWQYVNGSRVGRPRAGRGGVASEYRLTLPDDLVERVPMLPPKFRVGDGAEYHPNSDHLISHHLFSDQVMRVRRSPELNDRITRTEFAPPNQYLFIDPDTSRTSVVATSVEGGQQRASCRKCGKLLDPVVAANGIHPTCEDASSADKRAAARKGSRTRLGSSPRPDVRRCQHGYPVAVDGSTGCPGCDHPPQETIP